MSLEYRSGIWWIAYYPQGKIGGKKRFALKPEIQDKETAQKWHDEITALSRKVKEPRLPHPGMTVSEVWDDYLEWFEPRRAATTYRDILGIGKHVKEHLGKLNMEEIQSGHVQLYVKKRLASSSKSINRAANKESAYISAFIKWAGRSGYITPRPILIDKLPYKRPTPQVLTTDEVLKILAHAEPFYRTYFMCLYVLGLRSVEVRNLRWKDINWQNKTLMATQKGGTYKDLPLGPMLLSSLKEINESRANVKDGDFVFANEKTKKAVHDIRKAISRACAAAGVTKRVTPHLFRHSCATHMVDKNINLRIIQKFMGHSQISTTEYYTHVSAENLRAAGEAIAIDIEALAYLNGTNGKPCLPDENEDVHG